MRHMVTSHLSRLYQTMSETCGRGSPRTSTSRPSLRHSCAMSCAAWNSCGSAAWAPEMRTSLRTRSPCASATPASVISVVAKARAVMAATVSLRRMRGVGAEELTGASIFRSSGGLALPYSCPSRAGSRNCGRSPSAPQYAYFSVSNRWSPKPSRPGMRSNLAADVPVGALDMIDHAVDSFGNRGWAFDLDLPAKLGKQIRRVELRFAHFFPTHAATLLLQSA